MTVNPHSSNSPMILKVFEDSTKSSPSSFSKCWQSLFDIAFRTQDISSYYCSRVLYISYRSYHHFLTMSGQLRSYHIHQSKGYTVTRLFRGAECSLTLLMVEVRVDDIDSSVSKSSEEQPILAGCVSSQVFASGARKRCLLAPLPSVLL